jgi:LCP family protein required for cell wall assembly
MKKISGDDYYTSSKGRKSGSRKPKSKKGKIIGFSILGVLVVLLIVAGIYLYQALKQPGSLFTASAVNAQSTPKPMAEDIDAVTPSASTEPAQTSQPSGDNIVNVLLLGIDQDYKPYAAGGGDYHTDSIIVLAINFDKNTVDMISLPRDTFTHVPGVKGIYKLNAAINCGGGKTNAGFEKVCEAASWMLGGINIDYYYAFELDTVIEIGDMIGGVDFDVDMAYEGNSGAHYKKGMQHLDGTGIYDYMRARKSATGEPGDKGRMNRGKAMLKAIFKKLKEQGMLTQLPGLLSAVDKGMYTNTTLQQSIALANFGYSDIDMDKIGSHTMEGGIRSALSWNFWFIDQEARVKLIKEIYGIDVPEQQFVSYEYAGWLKDYGFKATRYLATAYDLSQYIKTQGEDKLSAEQQQSYAALKEAYKTAQTAYNAAALSLSSSDNTAMETADEALRSSAEAMAKLIDYPDKLSWTVKSPWYKDTSINEVDVDFN